MIKGLYRGLTKTDKKLVYGAYVFKSGTGNVYRTKDMHLISKPDVLSRIVYEDTVCMYTGKADKDGNKIFERDILEVKQNIKGFDVVFLYIVRDFNNGLIIISPCDKNGNSKHIDDDYPLDIPLYSVPSADIKIVGNTIYNRGKNNEK